MDERKKGVEEEVNERGKRQRKERNRVEKKKEVNKRKKVGRRRRK